MREFHWPAARKRAGASSFPPPRADLTRTIHSPVPLQRPLLLRVLDDVAHVEALLTQDLVHQANSDVRAHVRVLGRVSHEFLVLFDGLLVARPVLSLVAELDLLFLAQGLVLVPRVVLAEVVCAVAELDLGVPGRERPNPLTKLKGELLRDLADDCRLQLPVALGAVERNTLCPEGA